MSLYNRIIDLQKLSAAWQRVRRNKPAAGVDNIIWQQFDENSREELKQLQTELSEHVYMPLPVRNVTLYKGEKARVIALYSMRDKVVQQSISQELAKLFEGRLSPRSYAYRNEKSALQAVEDITAAIRTRQYGAVLKLDITHFFDSIEWNLLKTRLSRVIREEDVLDLIRMNACTSMLDEVTGELTEKRKGIHQGSSIAPILSNIFMMDFDIALARPEYFYVRYSDDILILGKEKEKLIALSNEIRVRLEELHLEVNEAKTICCTLDEGVDFLGYHLNSSGKTIPAKAEDRLYDRLETMWLTNPTLGVQEKAAKALEIVGGWQQYYRDERKMQSIYEYVAFAFALKGRREMQSRLREERLGLNNVCRDITEYLALMWKKQGVENLELLEYEQYYGLPEQNDAKINGRLLPLYRRQFVYETEETALELMQVYTDAREYENAQYWMEAAGKIRSRKERFAVTIQTMQSHHGNRQYPECNGSLPVSKASEGKTESVGHRTAKVDDSKNFPNYPENFQKEDINVHLEITERTPLLILETFAGRDDIYSTEVVCGNQHRKTELQELPLTEEQIAEHLRGDQTIGTYVQRPNSTVKFIVWDIDISKQFILKYGNSGPEFDACLGHAYHKALEIQKILDNKGMHGYIEFSGYRGYHVWLFLSEWIPVRFANMFTDRIEEELVLEDDITVECFPNKVRIKAGRFGQILKIPCGIHVRSGKRSCFVDDDGEPVVDIDQFTETIAHYSLSAIRKMLSYTLSTESVRSHLSEVETGEGGNAGYKAGDSAKNELEEAFRSMPPGVNEILIHCTLMQYLCLKAKRTGYLTHFERLSVLYVFGHVGEDGKEFVHDVMRQTMNYQYNVTQKFIDRLPEKPVSCVKLREQYRKVSAEVGCNCSFKRTKNCYPSPVLHAISLVKDGQDVITIPTSRTLSAEREKKVIEELNIHKKAQELAVRILELRKQKRSIEKSVRKVEKELEKVYDSIDANALEIEMGLLVRRKTEEGYEWVIEI